MKYKWNTKTITFFISYGYIFLFFPMCLFKVSWILHGPSRCFCVITFIIMLQEHALNCSRSFRYNCRANINQLMKLWILSNLRWYSCLFIYRAWNFFFFFFIFSVILGFSWRKSNILEVLVEQLKQNWESCRKLLLFKHLTKIPLNYYYYSWFWRTMDQLYVMVWHKAYCM